MYFYKEVRKIVRQLCCVFALRLSHPLFRWSLEPSRARCVAPISRPSDRFDPAASDPPAPSTYSQKKTFIFALFRFGSSEVPPVAVNVFNFFVFQNFPLPRRRNSDFGALLHLLTMHAWWWVMWSCTCPLCDKKTGHSERIAVKSQLHNKIQYITRY
jgi:hypothetical protein